LCCVTCFVAQVGDTSRIMKQNIDALRMIFYFYATLDEVRCVRVSSRTNRDARAQMIAPPKFSSVDICLEEFLYFLEDIGALKTAISVDDVSLQRSDAISN
jgi:hypothetical protein